MQNIGKWFSRNLRKIIISSFVIPILLVAFVSISHVTTFYELSNPLSWAIYLSVAIEIAALGALAGISANMGRIIYVPFGIVTLIQFIGNVFFSFTYIDETSQYFISWVDLVSAVFEPMGVEPTDIASHKRILSLFSGGLLPLISLTFAHMLVRFSEENKTNFQKEELTEKQIEDLSREAGKIEKEIYETTKPYTPTEEDLERLQKELEKFNQNTESEPVVVVEDEVVDNEKPVKRLVYTQRNADDNKS
jgi:hypothetical protein